MGKKYHWAPFFSMSSWEMSHCDAMKIDIAKWDRKCVPIFFCFAILFDDGMKKMRWKREMIFSCDWILMTFAIKSHSFIHFRGPPRDAHYNFSAPQTNYLLNIFVLARKKKPLEWKCNQRRNIPTFRSNLF